MNNPNSKRDREPIVEFRQQIGAVQRILPQASAQDILRSLIAAQERELGTIARELHDDICQRLALLSHKIEKVAKGWDSGQIQVGEQLRQIWAQCSELTGDVQALSHELHPSILDNLGLVAAVQSLCRQVSEQTGTTVEFTHRNVPDSLPKNISLCLFRLIQEALHNSTKYSGAEHCRVRLNAKPTGIELEVSDRGIGFDAANVKHKGGLGLVSMRERIHVLDGTITIDAKPNVGTTIRASVPLVMESLTATVAAS
jgi:signal transduction histidine kinase